MNAAAKLTFSQWLNILEDLARTHAGITLYDLPNLPYEAAYHRALTPEEAFETLVTDALDRGCRAAA